MSNTSRMDERIRELATRMVGEYFVGVTSLNQCVEYAIRLAVTETTEACAAVCDKVASTYNVDDYFRDHKIGAEDCATTIREKARERAK